MTGILHAAVAMESALSLARSAKIPSLKNANVLIAGEENLPITEGSADFIYDLRFTKYDFNETLDKCKLDIALRHGNRKSEIVHYNNADQIKAFDCLTYSLTSCNCASLALHLLPAAPRYAPWKKNICHLITCLSFFSSFLREGSLL